IFDRAFNLPAPPSLTVIQPAGAVPPYAASNDREGWAGEATLDVEWAHTMAPGARILLVETPTSEDEGTSGFPQIVTAELYVLHHHLGGVISQSFGATEQTFPTAQVLLALRTAYVEAADSVDNVTVLAASGDFGATDVGPDGSTFYDFQASSWPDTDPLPTAFGTRPTTPGPTGPLEAPPRILLPAVAASRSSSRGPPTRTAWRQSWASIEVCLISP